MTLAEYNAFCAALPATSHVVQWGGTDVWKVGGKVFALGRDDAEGTLFEGAGAERPLAVELLTNRTPAAERRRVFQSSR